MQETHFDEKSGVVTSDTAWGRWWQTVSEVHIEVDIDSSVRGKAVKCELKPTTIKVQVAGTTIFEGPLFNTVIADDLIWTLEEVPKNTHPSGKVVHIVLTKLGAGRIAPKKGESGGAEGIWKSLLQDEETLANPLTLHQMRQKLDLERFQIENPGFDFSSAKLAKCYDKIPTN